MKYSFESYIKVTRLTCERVYLFVGTIRRYTRSYWIFLKSMDMLFSGRRRKKMLKPKKRAKKSDFDIDKISDKKLAKMIKGLTCVSFGPSGVEYHLGTPKEIRKILSKK
jgi:hypothetical protein